MICKHVCNCVYMCPRFKRKTAWAINVRVGTRTYTRSLCVAAAIEFLRKWGSNNQANVVIKCLHQNWLPVSDVSKWTVLQVAQLVAPVISIDVVGFPDPYCFPFLSAKPIWFPINRFHIAPIHQVDVKLLNAARRAVPSALAEPCCLSFLIWTWPVACLFVGLDSTFQKVDQMPTLIRSPTHCSPCFRFARHTQLCRKHDVEFSWILKWLYCNKCILMNLYVYIMVYCNV